MEHLSNDPKVYPNQHEDSQKLCDETGHPVSSLMESHGNWGNNRIRISQFRKSHCRKNTSIRRKKEIKKGRTVIVTGIWVGKLTVWVWLFEIEKLWQSSSGQSVPPEYVSQSVWWMWKSPKKSTLADGLIVKTSSMLDEIESKTMHKDEEGNQ